MGRFVSADSIVPGIANPQAFNRYSYGLNNPIRYNDLTGHVCSDPDDPDQWCDGRGSYPINTSPLQDGPVYTSPEPLDSGQEQEDGDDGGSGGDKEEITGETGPNLCTMYGECDGSQGPGLNSLANIPTPLPPSPFACDWYDCTLSGLSVIFSLGTFPGMPGEIQVPAYVLDIVVTVLAFESTEDAYSRGEISNVHRTALNATGILGVLPSPSPAGLGLSIGSLLFTLSGYPRYCR